MIRRPRRGALSLCAALVLLATGISITPLPHERAAGTPASTLRSATGPVVVPDRFLVQTAQLGEPDRARLLAAIEATGATVNLTYSDTWTGVSVTASEAQLAAIGRLPGVEQSFPVYALQLDDPPAGTDGSEPGQTTQASPDEAGDDPGEPPAARAKDDTFSVDYRTPTVLDLLANDADEPEQAPLADSVVLTDPAATAGGKALEVAGRGTFAVDPTGSVTFVPAAGFTGPLDPVTYQVDYPDGLRQTARFTVTVLAPAPPVAADDDAHSTTPAAAVADVLANDTASGLATLEPGSLCLPAGEECLAGLEVDAGTWSVAAGNVTFTPRPDFTGTVATGYRVADELGQSTGATITVTVHPAPSPGDQRATTAYLIPVAVDLLSDAQSPGGAALDPESLRLLDAAGEPVLALAVGGEGGYEVVGPEVRFTPARGFTGDTTPVQYRVSDVNGGSALAALVVTVSPPGAPTAADDVAVGTAGRPVTVAVLGNDSAADGAELDPASVCLVSGDDCLPVVEPEGATWTTGPDGTVTFTPGPGRLGPAAITYRVADEVGQTATATLTVTVFTSPVATADHAATPYRMPVEVDVLANDAPGADEAGTPGTLDPGSVRFAANGTREYGDDTGSYLVDEATGRITFSPAEGFSGTAGPVAYEVTDSFGNPAGADLTITVGEPPQAADDRGHGPAGRAVAGIAVLANDTAGEVAVPLDPTTLRLTGTGSSEDGRTRTTAAGTWAVHDDATVSFTPDGFSGEETSTGYRVSDVNGNSVQATITVRIGAPTTAAGYAATTPQNVTIALHPLDLVSVGDTGELDGQGQPVPGSLDLATMRFTAAEPDQPTVLVSQGVGRWEVDPATGTVEFDPESAHIGTATAEYRVSDSFGATVTATITVEVSRVSPAMADDTAHTPANHPVDIPVLANDGPGHTSAALSPASLGLWQGDPAEPWTQQPLATAKGTWSVADGAIRFTPAPGVSGPSTLQYRVQDANGTTGVATVQVSVGSLPLAADDTRTVPQDGTRLTLQPLANDTPGDDGTGASDGFTTTSVVLTDAKATGAGKTLTGPGYTLTVDSAGQFDFAPDWRFTGTVSTGYRVTDAYGNSATARFTVTVTPTAPTATEKRLAAIGALDPGVDGSGIKVGIIDSGIDYTHPDLGGTGSAMDFGPSAPRVKYGYDFAGDQYDPNARENDVRRKPAPDDDPADCNGHGTHVAGIVGANGNPKRAGAYGVAPKVVFGAYRVSGCLGVASTDLIVAALQRADADGMNVVNLSLGNSSASWPSDPEYPFNEIAAKMVAKGVVVVAAVGNSGQRGLFTAGSPAVAPGVIAVAAADSAATRVEAYSSLGLAADLSLSPTLTAPGSGVYSTVPNGGRQDKGGTSMAAPHVAGAVAELLQAKGWKRAAGTPAKVAALLYSSATQLKSANSSLTAHTEAVFRQGAGLLQLDAALQAQVTASPTTVKLGEGSSDTRTITLSNSGTKAVTYKVSSVTGTSAAASTGTRTDVGNQNPYWAYGAVGFKASPSTVTVQPGRTASVKVTITAQSKILYGKQGLLYGGWVRFTATGQQTVAVPFAGVRGDYQKVKLLPSGYRSFSDPGSGVGYKLKLPALARQSSEGVLNIITSGTPTFRRYPDARLAYVMFHLDYPTSAIRLKAINTKTKKSYYAVVSGTSTQLGRRGRDEGYTALPFYGLYAVTKSGKTSTAYIPTGTYKLQLRVLKPLGTSSKSSHWETYTTRSFKLSGS